MTRLLIAAWTLFLGLGWVVPVMVAYVALRKVRGALSRVYLLENAHLHHMREHHGVAVPLEYYVRTRPTRRPTDGG